MGRRKFFKAFGWAGFLVGALGSSLFLLVRFLFPRVLYEPPMKFKAGPPSNFPPDPTGTRIRVYENFKTSQRVWIVHGEDPTTAQHGICAISAICTHLGCTPRWLENEYKYKCPCHGSGFYPWGVNFEGPAPHPLEKFDIRFEEGELVVDKSKVYRWENGDWEKSGAMYPTSRSTTV
jgi:cytochrome b6-f complex iron-sulfur subunit